MTETEQVSQVGVPRTGSAPLWDEGFKVEPALYSVKQAAVFLGVGIRTVNNLLTTRQLVRRKIGSRTLIPVTSLKAFLTKDHATKIAV